MSIMNCDKCDNVCDTDLELGSYGYDEIPSDLFFCEPCAEKAVEAYNKDQRDGRNSRDKFLRR